MATYHDAYVFKPEQFIAMLAPYLDGLQQVDTGYAPLRAAAIALFDRYPPVQYLAATYGDWERDKLLAGAASERPQGFHDIAFWFVIVLYSQLLSRPHTLGLGGKWETLAKGLARFGWDPQDITLLVRGRKFAELAQAHCPQARLGYWHHFSPRTKDGHAGWLELPDVVRLKGLLLATAAKTHALTAEFTVSHDDLQRSYRAALQMVTAAEEAQAGLCLIMAG